MKLRVTYDPAADAAYIYLVAIQPGEAVRQEVAGWDGPGTVIFDFNPAGQIIGVEVLNASSLLPDELLNNAGQPGRRTDAWARMCALWRRGWQVARRGRSASSSHNGGSYG